MSEITFADLGLPAPILGTLEKIGYQTPSPIQAKAIPVLLEGRDLIGQAQTGTGKTAAFALPILGNLDATQAKPQALVLAPTRELAMQVAEAFSRYSADIACRVLAVYGGQSMRDQLHELKRGVHVVVGTPGRLLDHLNRKSLDLSALKWVVLDEADEMLRMGFIDDVEAILAHTGGSQQTALFSATMPPRIKHIADRYLREPEHIVIPSATKTNESIAQSVVWVKQREKPAAAVRLLVSEAMDAAIIFCRTRESTTELADYLSEFGFAAAAINGDMNQAQREQTISLLKQGKIDVLVATDVAARGLDVERISHVINYDMPHDNDTYVHRIGRTGRAGRSGRAVLLADPRDKRGVRFLESATRQPLQPLELPDDKTLDAIRRDRFRHTLAEHIHSSDGPRWEPLIADLCAEMDLPADAIAAGLVALLAQQHGLSRKLPGAPNTTPILKERAPRPAREFSSSGDAGIDGDSPRARHQRGEAAAPMQRYRLAVGHAHHIRVGDIVGAIANEAGIDSAYIGRIQIHDDYTTVDLPVGMPQDVFEHLQNLRIRNQPADLKAIPNDGLDEKPRKRSFDKPEGGERKSFDRKSSDKKSSEKKSFEKKERFEKKEHFEKPAFEKGGFEKKSYDKKGADKKSSFKKDDGYPKKERSDKREHFEKPERAVKVRKAERDEKFFDDKPARKERAPRADKFAAEKPARKTTAARGDSSGLKFDRADRKRAASGDAPRNKLALRSK